MKHELKLDFDNTEELDEMIQRAYFIDGDKGKILGKGNTLNLNKNHSEYDKFKGLNNTIVKVYNSKLIDGSLRFLVEEDSENISLQPASIYCVKEDGYYSFY